MTQGFQNFMSCPKKFNFMGYSKIFNYYDLPNNNVIFVGCPKKVGGVTNKYPRMSTLWWGGFAFFHSQTPKN